MTAVTIRPVGEALGFELPEDLRARLKLKAGDILWLAEGEDGSLRILTSAPDHDAQMALAREGMAAYRETLRELAK